jgi:NAD(P)H-hydrate epimerase
MLASKVRIGLPADLPSFKGLQAEVADEEMVAALLPERPLTAHKGTFGTALIAAGSVNYTGAVILAGEAAYRVGAGLVTLAVPAPLHGALAGRFPEATWVLLPHELGVISSSAAEELAKHFDKASALLMGPGFGTEDATKEFIETILEERYGTKKVAQRIGFIRQDSEKKEENNIKLPPLVLDADALKLLADNKDWHQKIAAPAVLTPHPGEMAVLTGLSKELIQESRQDIASQYAKSWGHVVKVLKEATFTVVAHPDGRTTVIPVASPALAYGSRCVSRRLSVCAPGGLGIHWQLLTRQIHAAGLYTADDLGTTTSSVEMWILFADVLAI